MQDHQIVITNITKHNLLLSRFRTRNIQLGTYLIILYPVNGRYSSHTQWTTRKLYNIILIMCTGKKFQVPANNIF